MLSESPVILTFNESLTLNVSLRVCQWAHQANKARVVFNETPLLPPSETNFPKVHLACSALDSPLCRDEASFRDGVCG